VELGRVGELVRLRGANRYEVAIALDENKHGQGFEVVCGEVWLEPGEVVRLRCGNPMETRVSGRVMDSRVTVL